MKQKEPKPQSDKPAKEEKPPKAPYLQALLTKGTQQCCCCAFRPTAHGVSEISKAIAAILQSHSPPIEATDGSLYLSVCLSVCHNSLLMLFISPMCLISGIGFDSGAEEVEGYLAPPGKAKVADLALGAFPFARRAKLQPPQLAKFIAEQVPISLPLQISPCHQFY